MSEESPGISVAPREDSELQIKVLNDPKTLQALQTLMDIIQSSRGPSGKTKLLHNNIGGHVTVTSSSHRLLSNLSVSYPVLKLVTTAVQNHVNTFSDGGLFTASLAVSLIMNSMKLDIHRRLLTELYEFFIEMIIDYLQSENNLKMMLTVSDSGQMLALIRSVVGSKPGCVLTPLNRDHICRLVLSAFLKTFRDGQRKGCVEYMLVEGQHVDQSRVEDGVYIPAPHIPPYTKQKWNISRSIDGGIRIALFNVSMSGDVEEHMTGSYELSEGLSLTDAVLESIETCCTGLVGLEVGLVLCQRVLHPTVKARLRQHGVYSLDRLGAELVHTTHRLTGGTLIGSFSQAVTISDLGQVDKVHLKAIQDRVYVHLQQPARPVCTLVLCHLTEEPLHELKHVCKAAEQVLSMTVYEPEVLAGGGCWQTLLASRMHKQMVDHLKTWASEVGCTSHQLQEAFKVFSSSLLSASLTKQTGSDYVVDSVNHHLWLLPQGADLDCDWLKQYGVCQCGMVSYTQGMNFRYVGREIEFPEKNVESGQEIQDCVVLDSYIVSKSALQTGIGIANMVLSLHNCITDKN